MNTDTPYFRAVLTIAVIWIAGLAYFSYSGYQKSYQSAQYARYAVPEELTDECFSSVSDWSRDNVQFRRPTNEETQSCLNRARDAHAKSIASSNQLAFKHGWGTFLFKGLLPPFILLGIVAFWATIANAMNRAVSGYMRWLRFGSGKPIDQNKNDEA